MRGEMNTDPVEGEFFTPQRLTESLVREAIQNSLDAKLPQSQLRMRFALSGSSNRLPPEKARRYCEGLRPHIEKVAADYSLPREDEPMNFLVIEDFGTRGLCGDPEQAFDSDTSGPKNDFYYFWRNIGRSSKREAERGRWGLGKTVFPAASRINAFFGLTIRADDRKRLLMGQAVLKTHTIGDIRYCPYGFFAEFDQEFAMPVTDQELLENFCSDFGLKRTSEPGLSIVVPYFREEELLKDDIEQAVIMNYFYPILSRDLIVEFEEGT
ncbi:MAG: hypothetical protein JTT11_08975 [Candidatus Brockarchaeota archaeon]|nr:hypothetical protein [Candidatus Brockarchaeota archaeon]